MNIAYVIAILATLKQFDYLSGGSGTNLANVVFWSQVPRATCYRYLHKMTMLGFVMQEDGEYRNQKATMYSITDKGKKYLKGQKHE